MLRIASWIALGLVAASARFDDPKPGEMVSTPRARVETVPVPSEGDAADDPAIWVHPDRPAESLILGTDKKGGLHVYGMDGVDLQLVGDGLRPNNVDVLYGVRLGGRRVDLAVAGLRAKGRWGVKLWSIDPATRRLAELGSGPDFAAFDGGEPYGSCGYTSRKDGRAYVFVSDKDGRVEQYRIETGDDGKVGGLRVRAFGVGSQVEGCVADDEAGALYVAEEDVGIWKYGAEPDAGDRRVAVARVGEHGLVADVEGLAIYKAAGGKGYLLASSQGNSTLAVFERDGDNAFVLTVDPKAGDLGDVAETDGLDVTNVPTSARFPAGVLVIQDGKPAAGRQNFKLFGWEDVAGSRLRVDTRHPAR